MFEKRGYTRPHCKMMVWTMPTKKIDEYTDFGQRLAALRKTAGYTQQELADELDVTRRVIAYYEGETEYPPAALLPELAKVLNVSADTLLGMKPIKKVPKSDSRLLRRIKQIEKLPTKEKRQLVQVIDTYLKAAQI